MNKQMLVLPTCEVSNDPESAIELGVEWGIRHFELKTMWHNDRVPYIGQAQREYLKRLIKDHDVDVVAVSPGMFRGKSAQKDVIREEIEKKLPRTLELD